MIPFKNKQHTDCTLEQAIKKNPYYPFEEIITQNSDTPGSLTLNLSIK